MDEQYYFVTPEQIQVGSLADGSVTLPIDLPSEKTGLLAGMKLAVRMSAAEARLLAGALERMADKAEAAQRPH